MLSAVSVRAAALVATVAGSVACGVWAGQAFIGPRVPLLRLRRLDEARATAVPAHSFRRELANKEFAFTAAPRFGTYSTDPYFTAKAERNPQAPLPWPDSTAEIMVDAMSVIEYFWKKIERASTELVVKNDKFTYWPARVYMAVAALRGQFGTDTPPSPWEPLTVVYDLPDPRKSRLGMQVRKWQNLAKQGPRSANGVTLAFSQTYVDQSAAMRFRCDNEILTMLEMLTQAYPRRQVLVTGDGRLAYRARTFCTVRGPRWLEMQLERHREGRNALQALMGEANGVAGSLGTLPPAVRKAFVSQH